VDDTVRYLILPLLCCSPLALADSIPQTIAEPQVDATVAVTARSAGAVGRNEYWRIPGALMGGHAWPAEQGFSLDEMSLSLGYRIDGNFFALAKAAQHGSQGEHSEVAIEHASIGYVCCGDETRWIAETGRMSALFSPSIALHASSQVFVDTPLIADVFLGRHFHDDGLRLRRQTDHGLNVGMELWRGHAFPASADEKGGAADLFAALLHKRGRLRLETGIWSLLARAWQRPDHRYSEAHSHAGANAEPVADIRFTGDSVLGGVHGRVQWQLSADRALALRAEWMTVRADGDIADATRQALISSRYSGVLLQPELRMGRHLFALRGEQLVLDNHLTGAAAQVLAGDANLINDDNPWRIGLGWRWQWRDSIAVRAELSHDASTADPHNRVALGLVWQQALTRQGGHGH
jgi:hypothetical protein